MGQQRPSATAAFAAEDVQDARRGEPAGDLTHYANARGLRHMGSLRSGYLLGVAPARAEHAFNTCVGEVVPGRYGYVSHELQLVGFATSRSGRRMQMGGEFHGKRLGDPNPVLNLIPVVGDLGLDQLDDPPFPRGYATVPSTVVAMLVPEVALAPRFAIATASRMPDTFPLLADVGLPGYRLRGDTLDASERERLVGGTVARVLESIAGPYVRLEVVHGQLSLTVNGFLTEPAALERIVAVAGRIADGLATASHEARPASPFAVGLPTPPPVVAPPKRRGLRLGPITISRGGSMAAPEGTDPDGWGAGFARAADEFGLTREDPDALHRAFPRLGVPGRARGVLRGRLPGGLDGRLTVHQHTPGAHDVRTAVLVAAPDEVPATPVGGLDHEATGLRICINDGVVACWSKALRHAEIATADTSQRAARALHDLGITPA